MTQSAWILLFNTRHRCWKIWAYGAVPLLILTLIQTIVGTFREMEVLIWVWVGLTLLPGLGMLFTSTAIFRLPQKIIPRKVHKILSNGTLAYMVLLFISVLAIVEVVNTGYPIKKYFQLSFAWLLPTQVILLIGYYLVFFSKAKIARPSNRNILELAAENATDQKLDQAIRHCFELISKAALAEAFKKAIEIATLRGNQNKLNELTLLSGTFTTISNKLEQEDLNLNEVQPELNRITIGLIHILEKL